MHPQTLEQERRKAGFLVCLQRGGGLRNAYMFLGLGRRLSLARSEQWQMLLSQIELRQVELLRWLGLLGRLLLYLKHGACLALVRVARADRRLPRLASLRLEVLRGRLILRAHAWDHDYLLSAVAFAGGGLVVGLVLVLGRDLRLAASLDFKKGLFSLT